ncbi:MAG TPA: YfhO family protein [Bryobacteraceae bacterium]|nr:YfhO family protein [Bryobacteraceae bacterium]
MSGKGAKLLHSHAALRAALLLLIAQPLVFYRHVLFHPRMRIPYDIASYHLPLTAYIARCVRERVFPFWDPYPYCGMPIHADFTAQLFYPVTWIAILLGNISAGRNLFYWVEWLVPLHMILAGLFTFYLLRLLGVSIPAALFGGTVYQLGGFFASQAQHLGAICTGAWLPLLLACVWHLSGRITIRWTAVLALSIAMTILSGFAATMAVVLGAAGMFAIGLTLQRRPGRKFWIALAAGFLLGAGIAAVQLIPTFQLTGLSVASARAQAEETGGGLPTASLASLAAPNFYHIFTPFDPSKYTLPFNFTFLYVYCGLATLALLLVAPFLRKAPYVRMFFLLTIVCAFWMLGEATPVYRIVFTHLPRLVRGSLYAEFALLAFSLFAALTAAVSLERVGSRAPQAILWGIALVTAADLIHSGAERPMNSTAGGYRETPNEYEVPGTPGALDRLHTLVNVANPPLRIDYLQRDIFAGITAPAQLRLPTADGDNPFALSRVIALRRIFCGGNWWERQLPIDRPLSPLVSMLNVGFLAGLPQTPPPGRQFTVAGEFAGLRLYRNTGVLPRFFLVPRLHISRREEDTLTYLARPDFMPGEEAVVELAPGEPEMQPPSGAASVQVTEYSANRVELLVTATGPAFLASSEVLYPGWTATVNGRRVALYMTNGAFRGLALSMGTNRVVMTYRPEHFSAAALVSMICLLAAAGGALRRSVV